MRSNFIHVFSFASSVFSSVLFFVSWSLSSILWFFRVSISFFPHSSCPFIIVSVCALRLLVSFRSNNDFHTYSLLIRTVLILTILILGNFFLRSVFRSIIRWRSEYFGCCCNFRLVNNFFSRTEKRKRDREFGVLLLFVSKNEDYYLKWLRKCLFWAGSWWMWFMRHIGISREHINSSDSTYSVFFFAFALLSACMRVRVCVCVDMLRFQRCLPFWTYRCVYVISFDNQFPHRNVNFSIWVLAWGASTKSENNHILNISGFK